MADDASVPPLGDYSQTDTYKALQRLNAQQNQATNAAANTQAAVGTKPQAAVDALQAQRNVPGAPPASVGMTNPDYVKTLTQQHQQGAALQSPYVQQYVAQSPAHAAAVQDNMGAVAQLFQAAQNFVKFPWSDMVASTHAELDRDRRMAAGQPTDIENMEDIVGRSMIGNTALREAVRRAGVFAGIGMKTALDIANPIGSANQAAANDWLQSKIGPDAMYFAQQATTALTGLLPFGLKGAAPLEEPLPPGAPPTGPAPFRVIKGGAADVSPVLDETGQPQKFSTNEQAEAYARANPQNGPHVKQVDSAGNITLHGKPGEAGIERPEFMGTPVRDSEGNHLTFDSSGKAGDWVARNPPAPGEMYRAARMADGTTGIYTVPAPDYIGEPPLGHSPETDMIQEAVADAKTAELKRFQDNVANNPLHASMPAEEIADALRLDPEMAGRRVSIDAQDFEQLVLDGKISPEDAVEFTNPNYDPAKQREIRTAIDHGEMLHMELPDYVAATAGKPWADEVNNLAQHSDGGYSPQQVKDMVASRGDTAVPKGEEAEPTAPQPPQAAARVEAEPVTEEPKEGEAVPTGEGDPSKLSQELVLLASLHDGEIPMHELTNTQQEILKAAGYKPNPEAGTYEVHNAQQEFKVRVKNGDWKLREDPEAEHPVRQALNKKRGVEAEPSKKVQSFDIDDLPSNPANDNEKLSPLTQGTIPNWEEKEKTPEFQKALNAGIDAGLQTIPLASIIGNHTYIPTSAIKAAAPDPDVWSFIYKYYGSYYTQGGPDSEAIHMMSLGQTTGQFYVVDLDAHGLGLSDEDALGMLAPDQKELSSGKSSFISDPDPVSQNEEDLATHNFAPEKPAAVGFTGLDELKLVAPKPAGYSPGGIYEDASGVRWLVKGNPAPHLGQEEGDERAANEVLASYLFNAAIPGSAPELRLIHLGDMYNGGFGVASKIVDGLYTMDPDNPAHLKALWKTFALQAWLANRDAVGKELDNTLMHPNGHAITVDVGGAIRYTGGGLIKSNFGFQANDWDTLRDPAYMKSQLPLFKDMTDADLLEAASYLKNVTNSIIHRLIDQFGPQDPDIQEELRQKLIQRKEDILNRAEKLGVVPNPPSAFNPVPIQADAHMSRQENAALAQMAPTIKIAAKQAVEEVFLKAIFGDGVTLKMTKKQLRNWDVKVQEAQQAVYDSLIKKAKAKILAFRKEEWKNAYNDAYAETYQEFINRPEVIAYNQLKYAAVSEAMDFVKDNVLVKDGKPITFYRVDNRVDVFDGELPVDLFANPRTPQQPHPYWSNLIAHSNWGGASLAESREWVRDEWAQTKKGQYFPANPNHWNGPQPEKRPMTFITYVKTKKVGDFRNKKDLDRAIEWWRKQNPQGSWETDADYKHRVSNQRQYLASGVYGPWETPDMLRALGWDAVRMLEGTNQPRDRPNLYVINPEVLYWKYDSTVGVPTKFKLDEKKKGLFTKELLDQLPKGIWGKDGDDPENFAETIGYKSAEAMLQDMAVMEQQRGKTPFKQWLEKQIKIEAGKRAQDSLGWDLSPEAILEEARASVPQPKVEDLLTTSLHELAKQLGPGTQFSKHDIKTAAVEAWEKLPVKEAIRVDTFRNNVWNTMQKVEKGLLDGSPKSIQDAFTARLHALEAFYKLEAATNFLRFWNRNNPRFERMARTQLFKGADPEYWGHILLTLNQAGYSWGKGVNPVEVNVMVNGQNNTQAFVDNINANGGEIQYIPPIQGLGEPKEMPAAEFQAVYHSIKSLLAAAKKLKSYMKGLEQITTRGIISSITSDIIRRGVKYPTEEAKRRHFRDAMKRGLDPLLVRPETFWFDAGGQDPQSAANVYINRRMQEGKHIQLDLENQVKAMFDEFNATTPTFFSRSLDKKLDRVEELRFIDPEGHIHYPIDSIGELIHAVLHLGTDYNANVLLKGYRFERAAVLAAAEKYLNEHHLNMINLLWKINEFLWPHIARTYRQIAGYAPKKYDAVPFKIGDHEMTGGYEMLVYDKTLAPGANRGFSSRSLYGTDYNSALPPNPWAKLRTGYIGPLLMNLDTVLFNIKQKIHDVAWRPILLDVGKLVLDDKVQRAITKHYGPEFAKAQRPWLEYVARGSVFSNEMSSWPKRWLRQARANVTASTLMFQPTVPMKHFASALGTSASVVGGRDLIWAILKTAATPHQMMQKYWDMYNESVEMRTRWINLDRDLVTDAKKLMGKQNGAMEAYQMIGYMGIALSDLFSSAATYSAAKRQAIGEGYGEDWAIFRAEQAVRLAHGSNSLPDLPPILRQQETFLAELGYTTINMFTSFLNVTYNRQWAMRRGFQQARAEARRAEEEGTDKSASNYAFTKALATFLYAIVLPGVAVGTVQNMIQPAKQHYRVPWLLSVAAGLGEQSLGDIPVVSQVAHAMSDMGQGTISDPLVSISTEALKITYDSIAASADAMGLPQKAFGMPMPIMSLTLDDAIRFGGVFTPLSNVGLWHWGDLVYREATGTMPPGANDFVKAMAHGVDNVKIFQQPPRHGGRGGTGRGGGGRGGRGRG